MINENIIEHALERMMQRGTDLHEIRQVLKEGKEVEARFPRKAKEKVFKYNRNWQGKSYPEKKVKVIYIREDDFLTIITVYVYYGKWGEK